MESFVVLSYVILNRCVIIKPNLTKLIAKDNLVHCSSCEARIHSVLGKEPGIISIEANHKNQEINVYFDEETININEIKQKLETIGFPIE